MNPLSIVVSLMSNGNGYQRQQAASAEEAASRLGVRLVVLFADNDPIQQSQQLLNIIQWRDLRPDAIVCCPVGTGMKRVAYAAAENGIGWAIINRDVDYLEELRALAKVPVCHVSVDQVAVGKIQARQMAKLLPLGGAVLYLQGPASSPAVQARVKGMEAERPSNLQIRTVRGKWTEQSGYDAAAAWLHMASSKHESIDMVCSQNDDMAVGARKALETLSTGERREILSQLPYTGCDACEGTGREWLRKGMLTASIAMPSTAGVSLEVLVKALRSGVPPAERTVAMPTSSPSLETLRAAEKRKLAFA